MSDLFRKLQFKGSSVILLLSAPDEFLPKLAELAASVRIDSQLGGDERYDFALVFVKSCAEVEVCAAPVVSHMNNDAVLWFAYPKKSSKRYTTDLGRDGGWQPLGELGYEPVRMVAIDEDWSAMRMRHVSKIKSLTRSETMALSSEGKERVRK